MANRFSISKQSIFFSWHRIYLWINVWYKRSIIIIFCVHFCNFDTILMETRDFLWKMREKKRKHICFLIRRMFYLKKIWLEFELHSFAIRMNGSDISHVYPKTKNQNKMNRIVDRKFVMKLVIDGNQHADILLCCFRKWIWTIINATLEHVKWIDFWPNVRIPETCAVALTMGWSKCDLFK